MISHYFHAVVGILGVMEALIAAAFIGADTPVTSDPLVFFLSQGVLGIVCVLLYREYKDEKTKREEMTTKLIDDFIPLLTRGTEAFERMAEAEDRRRREAEAAQTRRRPAGG